MIAKSSQLSDSAYIEPTVYLCLNHNAIKIGHFVV